MKQFDTLKTVHDAMDFASTASRSNEPMINISVRMPSHLKEEMAKHCEKHGTSLSEFLRMCCEAFLEDYYSTEASE